MIGRRWSAAAATAVVAALLSSGCMDRSDPPRLLLGATHTLDDSGLLDTIASRFKQAHPGRRLEMVVAGSGEVLAIARRGDVDVILTHAPEAERAFVLAGNGIERRHVLRNEFIIAGPRDDPAAVRRALDAVDAFRRIRDTGATFISRADDSGTHMRELAIWQAADVDPEWDGYVEAGGGMADVLRVAAQRSGYTLTDIATFGRLQSSLDLVQLAAGDTLLRNEYSVIVVTDARNEDDARLFAGWITSPEMMAVLAAASPHAVTQK